MGNIQRIHNALSSIDKKLAESEQKLETVQQQLATAQEEVKKPFPKETELNEKMERLSELNALLNMDEKGMKQFWQMRILVQKRFQTGILRERKKSGMQTGICRKQQIRFISRPYWNV